MRLTWKEIKLATLQKMFSSDGTDITNPDESNKEYMNAMPQAANEAIEMLCTAGRYLRKSCRFTKEADVPLTVDLEKTVPNFWRTGVMEIYKMAYGTPTPVSGIVLYGGKYLVFPDSYAGEFEFFYDAKPEMLTLTTADDTVIDMPDDAVVLLPLYMASQLYKDDDITVATYYRNEFETAFERLRNPQAVTKEEFTSNTGWW